MSRNIKIDRSWLVPKDEIWLMAVTLPKGYAEVYGFRVPFLSWYKNIIKIKTP